MTKKKVKLKNMWDDFSKWNLTNATAATLDELREAFKIPKKEKK